MSLNRARYPTGLAFVRPVTGPHGLVMTVRHDMPGAYVYGCPTMRKQPRVSEPTRAEATITALEPTLQRLAVLDAYAETGTYELTAAATGMPAATVRNRLIEIRGRYGAATTIQAYRAALAAGDISAPACPASPDGGVRDLVPCRRPAGPGQGRAVREGQPRVG